MAMVSLQIGNSHAFAKDCVAFVTDKQWPWSTKTARGQYTRNIFAPAVQPGARESFEATLPVEYNIVNNHTTHGQQAYGIRITIGSRKLFVYNENIDI